MSQNKYLDSAGLTFYDKKLKDYFKYEIVDIVEDAIKELFPIPDNNYVTFTAEEDNSSIGLEILSTNQTLEYSTDTNIWNAFDTKTNISLNNGDNVYVRGMLNGDNTDSNYTQFKMTGKIAAFGNCNAIWNYQDLNAPLKNYCGYCLFRDCSSLITAPRILPATELSDYCYGGMFYNCVNLTTVPELPATELSEGCYYNMFALCNSLTRVQKILPATKLTKGYEYTNMFACCKSLIEFPELPATTLAESSYEAMFCLCDSLTSTPKLPATKLAKNCYKQMFQECPNITMTPVLPAKELADHCYYGMFYLCTKLTTASDILGTKQDSYSCAFMFKDCTSLTKTQRILPATILADNCYRGMFYNCTSLTTAPELPATVLKKNCYYQMFFGCIKLNHITCLATNISATGCTSAWVNRVASTGTFVKHPDATWISGNNGTPRGWTVVDAEL